MIRTTITALTFSFLACTSFAQEMDNPVCSQSHPLDQLVATTEVHVNEIRALRDVDHEAITFRNNFEDTQGRRVQFVYYAESESMAGFALFVDGPRNGDAYHIRSINADFRADEVDGAFPGEYTFHSVQFFTCEFLRRMRIDLKQRVGE